MADKRGPTIDEIFALIGFSTALLPHPASLLTVEQAATHADVPKSTVDSAVDGSNHFRELAVSHAIGTLVSEPGEATWAALRHGLRSASPLDALSGLLDARATELAADPAFSYFLGGFDCLPRPPIAAAVSSVTSAIIRRFIPFIETAVLADGANGKAAVRPDQAFFILHLLLAEAYRRLPGSARFDPASEALMTAQAAALILDDLAGSAEQTASLEWDSLFRASTTCPDPIGGRLGLAVRAGAELLLDGAIPFSMRLTVNDVTAATGMSVATFYRRFGSIAELEVALLKCVGREVVMGFRDDLFDSLLEGIRSGALEAGEAFAQFVTGAENEVAEHIRFGRPDRQTMPWMQNDLVAEAFRSAYLEVHDLRGSFFEQFSAMLGLSLATGLDGPTVSGVLSSLAIVSVLLVRNAPDPWLAGSVMHARFPRINAQLFT